MAGVQITTTILLGRLRPRDFTKNTPSKTPKPLKVLERYFSPLGMRWFIPKGLGVLLGVFLVKSLASRAPS